MSLEQYYELPDIERAWHEELARERIEQCTHCGRPRSLCSDAGVTWYPQRVVCYPTMEAEAARAKWARLHEDEPWHNGSWTSWAAKPSASHPYHRDFGLTIGVAETDLDSYDKFLSSKDCGPPGVGSDQATPAEAATSTGV